MRILRSVLLLVAFMLVAGGAVALSSSQQNKGAAQIELQGGTRGKVPFPHHLHQEKLVDCQICHAVFEQKSGSIEELKAQGQLKKKHVMNKLCTQCHKQKKKAGEKSGPTTCSKCHIKG
ncbi:MAG: cytochrome c3 family protein [Deltaproteobacteria bacterium]|nr:cytochrome c3 family protein [Deltaproteobacteria bacterium]